MPSRAGGTSDRSVAGPTATMTRPAKPGTGANVTMAPRASTGRHSAGTVSVAAPAWTVRVAAVATLVHVTAASAAMQIEEVRRRAVIPRSRIRRTSRTWALPAPSLGAALGAAARARAAGPA